jgi:hypothetical protein
VLLLYIVFTSSLRAVLYSSLQMPHVKACMQGSTAAAATELNRHCALCIVCMYCIVCVQVAGMLDLLRTQGRWEASARLAYQVYYIMTCHILLMTVTLCNRKAR